MRIISGKFKGRIIKIPKNLPIRPTTNVAKESIFNIISNKVDFNNLKVLDLFSGSGMIGLEFISRGSDVTFIENNVKCVKHVSNTLNFLNLNAKIIKKDSADIDSLLDVGKLTSMKMKNFPDILYNYVNQSVDRGTLDSLGRDFMSWLMNHDKISSVKKEKTAQYIKQNMKAFQSLWEVVSGIMKVKNNIISQLDSQASSVKASTAGKPGGEGYVLAHPGGDMKLVNRAGFTAANRAVQR